MAIPEGYTTIATVVPRETRDKLHAIATERGISVSRLLAAWLETGVDAPIERAGKRQSVRRYKDELMISLPRDWQRRTDIAPGQRVSIAYSDDALIVRI